MAKKRSRTTSYTGPMPFRGSGEFSGAEHYGFIRNAYIVYPEGLDGEKPNPLSLSEANYVRNTMGYRSNNELTGLNYLFNFLRDLAARERVKENRYLDMKLKQLEQDTPEFFKETGTIKALKEIIGHLRADPSKSPNGDTISSAFTLLLNNQGYKEIIRQIKSKYNSGGAAHDNSVYALLCRDVFLNTYEKYKRSFAQRISVDEATGGFRYRGKRLADGRFDSSALDALSLDFIEDFVNGVINKFHGLIKDEVEYKDKLRKSMIFYLKNEGFILGDGGRASSSDAEEWEELTGEEYTRIRNKYKKGKLTDENEKELAKKLNNVFIAKRTDKRQKAKKIHTIMDQLTAKFMGSFMADLGEKMAGSNKDILQFYFKQMGQEQTTRKSFSDVAGGTSHKATETTDSIIIDSLGIDFDTDIIEKLLGKIILQDDNMFTEENEQLIEDLEKQEQLEQTLRNSFKLHINTKTYKSQWDLHIVNENNLQNLTGKFKEISEEFYTLGASAYRSGNTASGYHGTHLGRMFDSLLFMLNNTVEGAAFSNDIEMVKSLIGFNCCMWMWDGMAASIKDIEGDVNGDNNIHIFQSGGAFFTVSDLLYEIVTIFQDYFAGEPVDSYIITEIKPGVPLSTAEQFYKKAKSAYPYNKIVVDEDDNAAAGPPEDPQIQLQKRWQWLRDIGLAQTTMSIQFRQNKLDKLLGRLSMLRIKSL